ncbi:MAG: hypothetical protein ABIG60_01915 [Patescibacteria group bacterium]
MKKLVKSFVGFRVFSYGFFAAYLKIGVGAVLILSISAFTLNPRSSYAIDDKRMYIMVSAELDEVFIFENTYLIDEKHQRQPMYNGISYLPKFPRNINSVPDELGFFTYEALSKKCIEKKLSIIIPRVKVNKLDNSLGIFFVEITGNSGTAMPVFFVESVNYDNKTWTSGFVEISDDYYYWHGEIGRVKYFDPIIK